MHPIKMLAFVFILIGLAGFTLGAVNYFLTSGKVVPSPQVAIQPIQPVVAPMLVGIGAMMIGGLMLVRHRSAKA
jgi:hypothetical protein